MRSRKLSWVAGALGGALLAGAAWAHGDMAPGAGGTTAARNPSASKWLRAASVRV